MKTYGLIGYPLSHSFSKKYFEEKFRLEKIDGCDYRLFPLKNISELVALLETEKSLLGFNVTIPYKQEVIPYLQELDETAQGAGAVNTVSISRDRAGKVTNLRGYNTDVAGFEKTLLKVLQPHHQPALVLGTGGASRAVQFVLHKLRIDFTLVSRKRNTTVLNCLEYGELSTGTILQHPLIINTTPCGMYPSILESPSLPYEGIGNRHLVVDLVYNPGMTEFLRKSKEQGALIKNGLEMLHLQADEALTIWSSNY